MPANICLPPAVTEKFKQALISGKINPEKLMNMTSEARHKLFSDIVGDGNAKFVNGTFEAKMLLKNKQQGMLTWAKKLTGVTPEIRRDLITRINKMDDRILSPEEEKEFLKDLASTKLGMNVSLKEAKQIANMSSKLQEYTAKQRADGTFPSEADKMAYGYAKVDLGNYLSELKNNANKLGIKGNLSHPGQLTSKAAGFAKSIKAAFDDSALLRQGWKTLLTHPNIWRKNFQRNIEVLYKQGITGKDMMRESIAHVVSSPNARYYEKLGITPKIEEEFGDPTLITKIPGIGRLYKTTEVAFNAFMLRIRADLADHYLALAKKAGVNIDDPQQLKAIGRMIGGLTGRGDLGAFEKVGNATNNIFFSPRFVKSQIDTVMHPITGAGGSNFVRKEAAKNLVKIVGMTAAIFATANALMPGSVELDPRSSKFGKIKVGDTTFDLTGGFAPIAVLAARLYSQQYKSNHGVISKLGDGVTPKGDALVQQFITGKLSPAAQRAWVNLVTKQEYNGSKPTLGSNVSNTLLPLPVNTYMEAKGDPHAANPFVTEIADAVGISANTTNPAAQAKKLGTVEQGLKDKVGDKKFQDYTNKYNDKLTSFTQTDYYKNLSQDKKQGALTHAQNLIKKSLFKDYGYKAPKAAKPDKSQNKAVENALQ